MRRPVVLGLLTHKYAPRHDGDGPDPIDHGSVQIFVRDAVFGVSKGTGGDVLQPAVLGVRAVVDSSAEGPHSDGASGLQSTSGVVPAHNQVTPVVASAKSFTGE